MTLRVLVKGSIEIPDDKWNDAQKGEYEARKKRYIAACQTIGQQLALKGMTIVVGVPRWDSLQDQRAVAAHVVMGASLAKTDKEKRHRIVFYSPSIVEPINNTPQVDTLRELRSLPNITIEDKFLGAVEYSSSMIPDLKVSDVVLLIGGGEGTASLGFAAYSLNKPIIAVATFGGAAKSIFDQFLLHDYETYTQQKREGLTDTDVRALLADWSDKGADDEENVKNAEKIVKLVARMPKIYNQNSVASTRFLFFTLGYLLLFLLSWVALFLRSTSWGIGSDAAFFALLFISATIGTGLRSLVAYQENELVEINGTTFAIDLVISLIVSLGLTFAYLLGGISFTGKVVIIGQLQDERFLTIGITMSTLGLAAGYLVPLAELRKQLETFISPSEKTG